MIKEGFNCQGEVRTYKSLYHLTSGSADLPYLNLMQMKLIFSFQRVILRPYKYYLTYISKAVTGLIKNFDKFNENNIEQVNCITFFGVH